jgi:hypothetical protein
MMHAASTSTSTNLSLGKQLSDHRNKQVVDLILIQIDRATVVDSIRLDDDFEPDGVFAMGEMREFCPICKVKHLKLVLRQKRVRRAHLFCDYCEKCFDARNPDGSSALELDQ